MASFTNSLIFGVLLLASHLAPSSQKSLVRQPSQYINDTTSTTPNTIELHTISGPQTRQLPPPQGGQSTCYPPGTNGQNQFLIGYGSLMQQASKDRTAPNTGESLPVRIYGYSRIWDCKGESVSYSTTYLGSRATSNKSVYFNAVAFRLPSAAALADYDTRESFYCREEVPMSKMQLLANTNNRRLVAGQYWVYVTRPEYSALPTRTYPIVQSYVDTFLSGCFEIEDKFKLPGFAEECVQTTAEWVNPWVNDRIFPRRPFMHQPVAGRIDRLLNSQTPSAFRNIIIE